jgi:hypothetical protein
MIRLTKIVILLLFVVLGTLVMPSASPAQIAVGISIHIGPPALPVYVQPICPAPGYIWTPGYWAYGPDGYFWVPGTWVLAPTPGYLWTPGYWGWGGGVYAWHAGYWGPHVGFYGGINYGFGYTGVGFVGGEWRGGVYHYNTAVTNINTTVIHNTYNTTVINNNTTVNRVSYNGGTGGVTAQPNRDELAAAREPHTAPTAMQTQHYQAASTNRAFLASENHGNPSVAATAKPGVFHGPGVVAAHTASTNYNRPPSGNNMNNANKPMVRNDRPPNAMSSKSSAPTNTNNNNRPNGNYNTQNNNHPNTEHPSASRPPEHESHPSKPPEHESHPGGSHPGAGRDR